MSTDVRQTNPADEGADASAYICEMCGDDTAEAFAWDADHERLYTASGEVVRGEWFPICGECNRAENPSWSDVGRETAARLRAEDILADARVHEARRDEEWRRRWHALVVDGMTTRGARKEARRQMHAEGWWA